MEGLTKEELKELLEDVKNIKAAILGNEWEDKPGVVRQTHTNTKNIERNYSNIGAIQKDYEFMNKRIEEMEKKFEESREKHIQEIEALADAQKELKNPFGKMLMATAGGTVVGASGATWGDKIIAFLKAIILWFTKTGGHTP